MPITQQSIRDDAERFKAQIRSGVKFSRRQQSATRKSPPKPKRVGDELESLLITRHKATCTRCFTQALRELNAISASEARSKRDTYVPMLWENFATAAKENRGWAKAVIEQHPKMSDPFYGKLFDEACDNVDLRKPHPVDVLILLNRGVDQSWQAMRGGEPVSRLQSLGISAAWTEGDNGLLHHLDSGAKVIINRAFAIDATTTRSFAVKHPQTKFVAVCHSSQSYLMHSGGNSLHKQNVFISLASELPNCYYATVDERNYPGLLHERCIYLPNVVSIPNATTRQHNETSVICLASRADEIKNTPQQIIALHILKQRGYQFRVAMLSNRSTALTAMAKQWRLPVDIFPWMQHDRWMKFLASVDVGLQCSFSESFNYVALEHLSCGIPVIGSTAIRYLPSRWQADPEHPEDIADKLALLLSHGADRDYCRSIATDVATECNQVFDATMRGLIDE